jgi:putative transposase
VVKAARGRAAAAVTAAVPSPWVAWANFVFARVFDRQLGWLPMWTPGGEVRRLCGRYNFPGHAHELTFSCHHRIPLLGKDRARQWFVDALAQARGKHAFHLWAYVIMPDHAHVLLCPRDHDYSVSSILQTIKQSVSRRAMIYLRKNAPGFLPKLEVRWPDGRVEHRFWQQGGGYDRNITRVDTAWLSVAYLHANPVRKGLVQRETDWTWSSARWYEGHDQLPIAMDARPA